MALQRYLAMHTAGKLVFAAATLGAHEKVYELVGGLDVLRFGRNYQAIEPQQAACCRHMVGNRAGPAFSGRVPCCKGISRIADHNAVLSLGHVVDNAI